MKSILLGAIIIITCWTRAEAQLQERNYFIGTTLGATTYDVGNFNYDYSSGNFQTQSNKNYLFQIEPSAGIFLSDHLVFGGSLNAGYSHDYSIITNTTGANVSSNHSTNELSFSIGPFARYYFFNFNPADFAFYIQANAGVGTGSANTTITYYNLKSTTVESIGTNHEFTFEGGGSFGLTYFIQKDIGLDIGVSYSYNVITYNNILNTETTTNGTTGGTSKTFKASEPQSGVGISAGFHLLLQ